MEVPVNRSFTAAEKFQCLLRESGLRKRVYPRLIEQGKLTKEKADRELAIMESIVEDYRGEADREAKKGRLL